MALVWIDPNYFGSLCSNPNKIQTNDMVGGVMYFCPKIIFRWALGSVALPWKFKRAGSFPPNWKILVLIIQSRSEGHPFGGAPLPNGFRPCPNPRHWRYVVNCCLILSIFCQSEQKKFCSVVAIAAARYRPMLEQF